MKMSYEELQSKYDELVIASATVISELQGKVEALAIESSQVIAMNDCLSEQLRGYESDGAFDGPNMHLIWWKTKTPATKAAIADIEARGVEKFADYYFFDIDDDVREFTQQLREGSANS